MPNRIIKESIWTSPNLNNLSDEAELLFYRLLPLPDDYGCFEADPRYLKGRLFPYKDNWSIDGICDQLMSLVNNSLIALWVENNRLYGFFPTWGKHQRIRGAHQRRTPVPPSQKAVNNAAVEEYFVKFNYVNNNWRPPAASGYPTPLIAANGGEREPRNDKQRQEAASGSKQEPIVRHQPQEAANGGLNPNLNPKSLDHLRYMEGGMGETKTPPSPFDDGLESESSKTHGDTPDGLRTSSAFQESDKENISHTSEDNKRGEEDSCKQMAANFKQIVFGKNKEPAHSSEPLRLSWLLGEQILANNPDNRELKNGKREATIQKWSVEIERMMRLDGRPAEETEAVIKWSQREPFWKTNILSAASLRKHYDQLKMQMARTRDSSGGGCDARFNFLKGD